MKVLKVTVIVLSIIFIISSIFFVKDYFDKSNKYNEFKNRVAQLTTSNEDYIESNKKLLNQVEFSEKEKQDLNKKLAEKKIEIIYKEKIIYKDGQLIIPKDYDELKNSYATLSNLYIEQKKINSDLEEKSINDSKTISDLSYALNITNKKLMETTDLLNGIVDKPSKFFQSSVLISGALNSSSQYEIGLGYMLTIKDKVQIGTIASYPLKVQVFFGVKL